MAALALCAGSSNPAIHVESWSGTRAPFLGAVPGALPVGLVVRNLAPGPVLCAVANEILGGSTKPGGSSMPAHYLALPAAGGGQAEIVLLSQPATQSRPKLARGL